MKGTTCPKCGEYILTSRRKKELEAQPAQEHDLHRLISSIFDVQHMRLIFEGRFRDTNETWYALYADRLFSLESQMKDDAEEQTKLYPIHEWIIAQRGLSYDIAGQLIGLIQDIKKFDNISKLWAYFGLAVIDVCQNCDKRYYPPEQQAEKILHISKRLIEQNEKKIVKEGHVDFLKKATEMVCTCEQPHLKRVSQHKIKGALLDYNPDAKMVAYKVGVQFVKQGELYRKLFEQFKAEYQMREDLQAEINSKKGKITKHGESKGTAHIHNMAQRKVVKIFLSHLWAAWRKLEGLEVTKPYVIDRLGHSDYIVASQSPPETQALNASHHLFETHCHGASHHTGETPKMSASQAHDEIQMKVASHCRIETHCKDASQTPHETHPMNASHIEDETQ